MQSENGQFLVFLAWSNLLKKRRHSTTNRLKFCNKYAHIRGGGRLLKYAAPKRAISPEGSIRAFGNIVCFSGALPQISPAESFGKFNIYLSPLGPRLSSILHKNIVLFRHSLAQIGGKAKKDSAGVLSVSEIDGRARRMPIDAPCLAYRPTGDSRALDVSFLLAILVVCCIWGW